MLMAKVLIEKLMQRKIPVTSNTSKEKVKLSQVYLWGLALIYTLKKKKLKVTNVIIANL